MEGLVVTEKEEFSKLSSLKKCPLCGGDLDRGYLLPVSAIYWDTEKHGWFAPSDERLIPYGFWKVKNVPALRCIRCKIAIFDYEHV